MQKKALVVLAEGFEEIEAITVIDILRRCEIAVRIASLSPDKTLVKGSRGISVQADIPLADIKADFDACVLPGGGPGAERLAKSDLVNSLISVMDQEQKIIAAICAVPALVLAPAGILNGKNATCYPGMQNLFSASTTYHEDAVVTDGNIITSRGVGTALDFAFAIAEKLVTEKTVDTIRLSTLAG